MTADLDDLLEQEEIEPPTVVVELTERKCVRHKWINAPYVSRLVPVGEPEPDGTQRLELTDTQPGPRCGRCGKVKDEALSRRGRNSRKRGGRIQRQRIVGLGGRNLAGNNPNLDGLGAMFAYESKSGACFSERYWRWLAGIPKRGNETGVLIVTEAPGPGRKARSFVVVEYDEWRDLHGADAA